MNSLHWFRFFSLHFALILNQTLSLSSWIKLLPSGYRYQPTDNLQLILEIIRPNLNLCMLVCQFHSFCQVFEYHSLERTCQMFNGSFDDQSLVLSNDVRSVVGIVLNFCSNNQFLDGITCVNQLDQGESCLSDEWCRSDLNLFCDPVHRVCTSITMQTTGTSTSTTSTTRTTTSTTATTTTTTRTTTSTTATTTSTTRTTTSATATTTTTTRTTTSTTATTTSTTRTTTSTTATTTTTTRTTTSTTATTTSTTRTTTSTTASTSTLPASVFNASFPAPINSSNAAAELYNVELLVNGNAEIGSCSMNSVRVIPLFWSLIGSSNHVSYLNSFQYGPTPSSIGPSNRGSCYFYGGNTEYSTMSQTINLAPYAINIDNQRVNVSFSAWMGGYEDQDDEASAKLYLLSENFQQINQPIEIGPITQFDRNSITSLLFRQTSLIIPSGTRFICVMTRAQRYGGTNNDGYIDNISVVLYRF